MNPLLILIVIIMAIFTIYNFRIDIMNWYNTGGTFAEGFSSKDKMITYRTMTSRSNFGGDGLNPTTKMEWIGKECAGGKIKWSSAKSLIGTTVDGKEKNWKRDTWQPNLGKPETWLGGCGVAPKHMPELPTTVKGSKVSPTSTTTTGTQEKCINVSQLGSASAWVDHLFQTLGETKCADKNKIDAAKTASKLDFVSGTIKGYQNDIQGSNKYYMQAIDKAKPYLEQAFANKENNLGQDKNVVTGNNTLEQITSNNITHNPSTNLQKLPDKKMLKDEITQQQTGHVLANDFIVQKGSGHCPNGCKFPQYDNAGCVDTLLNNKAYRKCEWIKDGENTDDCGQCGSILMPKNQYGYARTRPGLFDNISVEMAIKNSKKNQKGDYYNIGKNFMKQLSDIKHFELPNNILTDEFVAVGKLVHKHQTENSESSNNLITRFINGILTTGSISRNNKINNNSGISEQTNSLGGIFDIDNTKLTGKGSYAFAEAEQELSNNNRLGGSSDMYEKEISEKVRIQNGIPRDPKKRPNPYNSMWNMFGN